MCTSLVNPSEFDVETVIKMLLFYFFLSLKFANLTVDTCQTNVFGIEFVIGARWDRQKAKKAIKIKRRPNSVHEFVRSHSSHGTGGISQLCGLLSTFFTANSVRTLQ